MPGRRPAEAVRGFLEPIGRALTCVTRAVARVTSYQPGGPHALLLNDGTPVRLAGSDLRLGVAMQYRVVGTGTGSDRWRVTTAAYRYAIETRAGGELLAYHWHPRSAG